MSGTGQRSAPDLSGRMARCRCGRTEPSSFDLRRFEYQGPGSRAAEEVCVCGYHRLAHHDDIKHGAVSPTLRDCGGFQVRGDLGIDSFWCGCGDAF